MDFILILKAIMLGLVEGATEFLPISSTGHLIIVGDLIDFLDKEKRDVFEIVIQLGSILSVVWLYQHRFKTVVRTIASDQQSQKFALQLFVAFLPLAVLGLLFHSNKSGFIQSKFCRNCFNRWWLHYFVCRKIVT